MRSKEGFYAPQSVKCARVTLGVNAVSIVMAAAQREAASKTAGKSWSTEACDHRRNIDSWQRQDTNE
jgi:hypothetical protein